MGPDRRRPTRPKMLTQTSLNSLPEQLSNMPSSGSRKRRRTFRKGVPNPMASIPTQNEVAGEQILHGLAAKDFVSRPASSHEAASFTALSRFADVSFDYSQSGLEAGSDSSYAASSSGKDPQSPCTASPRITYSSRHRFHTRCVSYA